MKPILKKTTEFIKPTLGPNKHYPVPNNAPHKDNWEIMDNMIFSPCL